jgi:hypothetical protein
MIRGVGRDIRNAAKDAARKEGVGVGAWVRRSIIRALNATADEPATIVELSEHVRILGARLSVLENSHRVLHQEVHAAGGPAALSAAKKRTRWRHTRKSK